MRWKSATVLGQDEKLLFLRYGNFIRRVPLDRIIPADQCHNVEEDIDKNDIENKDRLLDEDFSDVEIVAQKEKQIEELQRQAKEKETKIKELENLPLKRCNVQTSCILPKKFQKILFKTAGMEQPLCAKVMTKHKSKSIHRNVLGLRFDDGMEKEFDFSKSDV